MDRGRAWGDGGKDLSRGHMRHVLIFWIVHDGGSHNWRWCNVSLGRGNTVMTRNVTGYRSARGSRSIRKRHDIFSEERSIAEILSVMKFLSI